MCCLPIKYYLCLRTGDCTKCIDDVNYKESCFLYALFLAMLDCLTFLTFLGGYPLSPVIIIVFNFLGLITNHLANLETTIPNSSIYAPVYILFQIPIRLVVLSALGLNIYALIVFDNQCIPSKEPTTFPMDQLCKFSKGFLWVGVVAYVLICILVVYTYIAFVKFYRKGKATNRITRDTESIQTEEDAAENGNENESYKPIERPRKAKTEAKTSHPEEAPEPSIQAIPPSIRTPSLNQPEMSSLSPEQGQLNQRDMSKVVEVQPSPVFLSQTSAMLHEVFEMNEIELQIPAEDLLEEVQPVNNSPPPSPPF